MNKPVAVLLFAALTLPSALAQTSSDAILQSLLNEVRQLRLALEKSAVVTPRLQVALQRMQLQQDAVARASRELEEVRNQVAKSKAEAANVAGHIAELEAQAPHEQDAVRRRVIEDEVSRMKSMKEDSQGESRLLARESDLTGRLQAEQARLSELSERINSLERMLDVPLQK